MKKLLVVFVALLVVALAVPVMAADRSATWGGEFTFGGITGFSEEKVSSKFGNIYFDGTIPVDDYNDVVFELAGKFNGGAIASSGGTTSWQVGAAYLLTDIGGFVGLPVGLTAKGGWFGFDSRKFEVSGHGWERKYRPGIGKAPMFLFNIDAGMVIFDVGFDFDNGGDAATPKQDYVVMASVPDVAGLVSIEAGYFIKEDADFKGQFTANAKAEGIADMVDAAFGFGYDTTDNAGTSKGPDGILLTLDDVWLPAWWWGLGVKANVSMLGIGVSVNGEEEMTIDKLGVDVNAAVTDEFGVDIGLGLNLDKDALETFGGFSFSAYYKPGVSKWRVGYVYTKDGVYDYQAPILLQDASLAPDEKGGLFISCDIDF